MKTKQLLIATAVLTALAACTSDDFVGNQDAITDHSDDSRAISFGSANVAMTRADQTGATAAGLLGSNFVVEGVKGNGTAQETVFDHYNVNWVTNTANTTTSNTNDWEYVAQTKHDLASIAAQSIKYWDYSAAQYDFIAFSKGSATAVYAEGDYDEDANVLFTKITPSTLSTSAYTIKGKAAELAKVYIADMVTAYASDDYDDVVRFKFRSLSAKIRIGLYETIPGYSVKDVKFYRSAADNAKAVNYATLYAPSKQLPSNGEFTVYFPTVGSSNTTSADYNKAHLKFASSGTKAAWQNYGELSYGAKEAYEKTTGNIWLARSTAKPTWAVETGKAAGNYSIVLPNEDGSVLTLKIDYTLESTDGSGEEITVHGATAIVPAQYTKWKSNYAYTYIFKISDNTNGKTDATKDVVGLYPITFDAVVIDSEENTQETITTVATPSITTYSVTSKVTTSNEYKTSDVIYVTTTENGTLLDMTGKATLYTVSETGATEAEVIDALNTYVSNTNGTYVGRNDITLTPVNDGVGLTETEIPLVDGNKITDLTKGTVGKLKAGLNAGTYAFVYTKTAATTPTAKYQEVTITGGSVEGYYTYNSSTSSYEAATEPAVADTKYFAKYIEENGVYAVKVIKIVN